MKNLLLIIYFFSLITINAQELTEPINDRFSCCMSISNSEKELILCDSIHGFEWYNSSWELGNKEFFSYNLNGKITDAEFYKLNENNEWEIERRREWIYDANGLFIEFLYQRKDLITLEFEITNITTIHMIIRIY